VDTYDVPTWHIIATANPAGYAARLRRLRNSRRTTKRSAPTLCLSALWAQCI